MAFSLGSDEHEIYIFQVEVQFEEEETPGSENYVSGWKGGWVIHTKPELPYGKSGLYFG